MNRRFASTLLVLALGAAPALAADAPTGKSVYQSLCSACHDSGAAGAPKVGDAAAWASRLERGLASLQASAISGKGTMPAKGGNPALSDADVRAAVAYMLERSGAPKAAAAPAKRAVGAAPAPAPAPAQPAVVAAPVPAVASAPAAARAIDVGSPNAFNRLLRAPAKRNVPPPEDGIHDPAIEEAFMLQPPLDALGALPPSNAGNHVDWVRALGQGKIAPRNDRLDPKVQASPIDLNIVREVKGSMPDVVYPHKQHTQWLDCANCHPAIFKPQKGANAMSMASIILGEQCGVCHGKVAFPVSECRLCHSKSKTPTTTAGATKP
jgi:c(7)-type cytochrome triheme protein